MGTCQIFVRELESRADCSILEAGMGEWRLLLVVALTDGTQFKKQDKPSFRSVNNLMSWMDSLPQGPRWHCTKIEMDEYVTVHPVYSTYSGEMLSMSHK